MEVERTETGGKEGGEKGLGEGGSSKGQGTSLAKSDSAGPKKNMHAEYSKSSVPVATIVDLKGTVSPEMSAKYAHRHIDQA